MRTDNDTIMEAAAIKAASNRLEDGTTPFIVIKGKPVSLEHTLNSPTRARGTIRTWDISSAKLALSKYQSPKHGVACFWRFGVLTIYLNFHTDPNTAGWCDFKITCFCTYEKAKEALKPNHVMRGAFKPSK